MQDDFPKSLMENPSLGSCDLGWFFAMAIFSMLVVPGLSMVCASFFFLVNKCVGVL